MKLKYFIITLSLIFCGVFSLFAYVYSSNEEDLNELKIKQVTNWGYEYLKKSNLPNELNGEGIKIAIMDSGIDFNHDDLGENIKEGYNAINPNKSPIDDYNHGTAITGVIGAKNNSVGIVGIAPKSEIYPVKVLDEYGEGDLTHIVDGIMWCIENDIDIINMSFAIEIDDKGLKKAINKAIAHGIIVVASASNYSNGEVWFPAEHENVISVTAIDQSEDINIIKARGKIDFSGPGFNIKALSNSNDYINAQGTSIATPYITGITALILQKPNYFGIRNIEINTNSKVYKTLQNLSKDLGESGYDEVYGHGIPSFENYKK